MTISIDRYQTLMNLPIAAFNGLNKPDETPRYACSTIWKQSERENLALYLEQAQEMREKELRYFLTPTYTEEEFITHIRNPQLLVYKHTIALGKKMVDEISFDHAIAEILHPTLDVDPVTIVVATTVTDVTEVHVYKEDALSLQSYEVTPSYIAISGGMLTLKIPRSRLVKPELLDDRDDHLDYYDDTNYVTTLDIQREWTDPSQAVDYEYNDCESFTVNTYDGYGVIRDARLSIIESYPATWSGQVATPLGVCADLMSTMKVSYLSGMRSSNTLDLQTIRLAHTLMPHEPCTCEPVHQYWLADVDRDPSGLVTPYGSTKASIFVWIADSRSRIGYGATIGGIHP